MSGAGKRAIEDAADRLGEMMLETAEGAAAHAYEDLAAAALAAGLDAVCDDGPDQDRIEAVAAVLHAKLHTAGGTAWNALSAHEKSFWFDIARAAITASDGALRNDIAARGGNGSGGAAGDT